MSLASKTGIALSMFRSLEVKVHVEMKSAKQEFMAKVREFISEGEHDTLVVFSRVEDTVFPTDSEHEKT